MSEATPPFDPSDRTLEGIVARLKAERRARRVNRRPDDRLHVRPHLAYYQDEAHRLHKAQRQTDPSSKLHSAQFEIAKRVGLASWPALVAAIEARSAAAKDLLEALGRKDREAVLRILSEHPLSLLDAGCVAPTDELGFLLNLATLPRGNPDMLTELLDAVAEHHKPEGLEECVGMLLNRGADPFYANDTIEERRARVEATPTGAQAAELFEGALGVLAWYVDEPEDGYMTNDD